MKSTLLLLASLSLVACDNTAGPQNSSPPVALKSADLRGYTVELVNTGKRVFENNCQICHGVEGQGLVKAWQKRQTDGNFPAPPLNGTAHTWHHDLKTLLATINRGGVPLGGTMPAFKDVLSDDEKIAVLAYIQNLWSDDVYQAWVKNNKG